MIEDYRKAQKRGRREVSHALSRGLYPYLPALDEVLDGSRGAGEIPVGVREIPMALIVGTKTHARSNVFSHGFLPIADASSEFAAKWSDLYDAQKQEGIRDPVVVYEYLQRFYVQEGNKRVSVLRSLDTPIITASITRILPRPSDEREIRCYHEFLQLYRVAPVYGLIFSEEGSCEQLAKLLGQNLQKMWPEELVSALTATLYQFRRAYLAHGGERLKQTTADAFLMYVKAYASSTPLQVSESAMDLRVARLWGEFVVTSQKHAIAYIENPTTEKGGLLPSVKGVARSMLRSKPLSIAFIYDRNPQSSGWCALHEQGRLSLQEKMSHECITTAVFDKASDADFMQAVSAAIAAGADVIVTTSPRQMNQALRAAIAHPERIVINCSINLSSHAVRSFYARMYEVKFLMGALAASLTHNHQLGYLASSPLYGSVAEINAFALGAALVDPYCKIHLKWTAAKDYNWHRELKEHEVQVLSSLDYPNPLEPDEPYGLIALSEGGKSTCTGGTPTDNSAKPTNEGARSARGTKPTSLALPVWNWGHYYELLIQAIQDARWRKDAGSYHNQALNYWWGMSADVVGLQLQESISTGQRKLIELLRRDMIEGRLHPFEGKLVAAGGKLIHQEGAERLSNEEIASMRWLNENVIGRLPKSWELSPRVAEDVAISGVISPETDAAY